MQPEQAPFKTGWYSFELPDYRDCESTYCLFPYASVPPLEAALFRGEFGWLPELTPALRKRMEMYRRPEAEAELAPRLVRLQARAQTLGLSLPSAFVKFMGTSAWLEALPSCTACYFDLAEELAPCPLDKNGYLLRFLNDQQGVLLWYLYFTRSGEAGVVVSPIPFDDAICMAETTPEQVRQATFFCAPDFEMFVYRFWLENEIWFALNDGRPLTEVQQRYLDHYKKDSRP